MKRTLLVVLAALLLLSSLSCAGRAKTLIDGTYSVSVTLSGGSGRASVESPATLVVKDGVIRANVVWSSPYYEWMQLDGVQYTPIQAEGNSTFEIPVQLDTDIAVSAQTVAMSEPHVVEYTLHFDSSSVQKAD